MRVGHRRARHRLDDGHTIVGKIDVEAVCSVVES
jgi:hypothetical protein